MFSFLEIVTDRGMLSRKNVTQKIFFPRPRKALLDHIQPNFIDRRTEIRIDSI